MVFQNYALFPHMSVFENIAFSLRARGVSAPEIHRRVGESLDMMRLPGLEQRKPAQLSGGQQQRVALARALVNRPAVLLLDEPLGALDQKLRKDMQLELKRLQREVGITFVYVTHDQEEALTMSDRIAVMYQGRVLQVGGPRQVYNHPATRFVADFIGTTNFVKGRVISTGSELATVELDDLGPVCVPQQEGFNSGQAVTLAIRPERLSLLSPALQEQVNSIEGILEEIIFVGNDTQYLIRFRNGTRFFVREQNHSPAEVKTSFQPGQPCHVYWMPASTNVLQE
jgi:spermidine/putrescine transport system ATP-binding protein